MTQVQAEDGSTIVTDLPAEKVADLQQPAPEPAAEPAKPAEAETPPAKEPKTEEPADPAKEPAKEPEPQPTTPVERPQKKLTPFQTLLDKKHEAETQRDQALADKAELEAKLQQLSEQKPGAATDGDIAALAEELGADPAVLEKIVAVARKGMKPELPKEVTDLIAKQQQQEQVEADHQTFKADVGRLQTTLKDELLKDPAVQEKLQALAYSTEKAPDGEPYYQKPLYELYMTYVKPEAEPGKPSIEPARTGPNAGGDVMDFQQIHNDDAQLDEFAKTATAKQWAAYTKWRDEKQGDVPITKART
jgi:hypothetical protein